MKKQFIVTVDIPERSSISEVREYISDALNSWWGQFRPPNVTGYAGEDALGDPLWRLPRVTVRPIK